MRRVLRDGAILAIACRAVAFCVGGSIFGVIAPEPHSLAKESIPHTRQNKVLTFADRVAYQYAIEESYRRHRIWPRENPGPKPSLDEVISPMQIQKKVEDYLRDSHLLADQWQRPITVGELQGEMDRMASHTKQPEVLRELFDALDNDPFVIAECLARPILAERLVSELRHHADDGESTTWKSDARTPRTPKDCVRKAEEVMLFREALGVRARPRAAFGSYPSVRRISLNGSNEAGSRNLDSAAYKLPQISVPADCTGDTWTATSTNNAPSGRRAHTAVWTGIEMIVWGGLNNNGLLSTGGRYNPSTDSWSNTNAANAPSARSYHCAVWTGNEVIIWGGSGVGGVVNTGVKYNPSTDSWASANISNAPSARKGHTAVWTGTEIVIWGGQGNEAFSDTNTGGRYNPSSDSWTATSITNSPSARSGHTAVWTGSEIIIWGGSANNFTLDTGGRYNPTIDSWITMSTSNAPHGRYVHTTVWTGNEMIIWGGAYILPPPITLSSGGKYDPIADTWTPTSDASTPGARGNHTAIWTGTEMIIWGGYEGLNTGGRYNPSTNSWIATAATSVLEGRGSHTAIWTGNEMIIWGGYYYTDDYIYPIGGGRYCAQPSAPIVQSAVSRKAYGGAGNFDVNLPLSGTPGIECRLGGGTNDYKIVVTFLANVSINGNPQATVASGTGVVGSSGVSNGGMVTISGNVVTIPLTNVANAQTIDVTLNGVNGSTNVAIPMGVLLGDITGDDTVNAADVMQTKSRLGQAVDATNFRSDVNANGTINATDVSIVKSAVGTGAQIDTPARFVEKFR